jgi:hypothetical protein
VVRRPGVARTTTTPARYRQPNAPFTPSGAVVRSGTMTVRARAVRLAFVAFGALRSNRRIARSSAGSCPVSVKGQRCQEPEPPGIVDATTERPPIRRAFLVSGFTRIEDTGQAAPLR